MHIAFKYPAIAFSIVLFSCGQESVSPLHKSEGKGPDRAASPLPEVNNSEKHVFETLKEDARRGLQEGDLSAAARAVEEGIRKTENRPGLEIINAHFLLQKGEIALAKSNEPDARRFFSDAMALFHVHKNEEGRFEAFTALGRLEARRGDYAAAERQFDQAEAIRKNFVNPSLVGKYLTAKGRLASRQMHREDSVRWFQEAVALFDGAKDKQSTAEVLVLLSFEDDQADRLSAARRGLERAAVLFEEIKDMRGKVRAIHRLAFYAEREKQNAKAARLYNEAAALYRSLGDESSATAVEMHVATLSTSEEESKKKK